MKMQSGQKLVFYEKEVIKALIKTDAARKAITFGNIIGKVGTVFTAAGIGITWIQVYTGDKHVLHGFADTGMAFIGFIPGAGTAVSVFYFRMTNADNSTASPSSFINTGLVPIDNTYVAPSYPKIN